MWKKKKVSVILPTYREKDSIRQVVDEFAATGYVDEIIVVNNNAEEGTSEEIKGSAAVEIFEPQQGYGSALQRGMAEATGDLFVWCEPDGTFLPRDIIKFLAYSDDFEVILGTRTTSVLIWSGANMGRFLRYGNFAVAKMVEFLFNTTHLSDVGCTFRLLSRGVYDSLKEHFTVTTSHFGPEFTLLAISRRKKFIEIPVNYRERVGTSSVTGDFSKAWRLGWRMIFMIIERRFKTWFRT